MRPILALIHTLFVLPCTVGIHGVFDHFDLTLICPISLLPYVSVPLGQSLTFMSCLQPLSPIVNQCHACMICSFLWVMSILFSPPLNSVLLFRRLS